MTNSGFQWPPWSPLKGLPWPNSSFCHGLPHCSLSVHHQVHSKIHIAFMLVPLFLSVMPRHCLHQQATVFCLRFKICYSRPYQYQQIHQPLQILFSASIQIIDFHILTGKFYVVSRVTMYIPMDLGSTKTQLTSRERYVEHVLIPIWDMLPSHLRVL